MPTERELPDNNVTWAVDPRRAVLLIHDMQRYFMKAFPPGGEPGATLIDNIERLRERCHAAGVQVAYTAQPGGMTEQQRGLLKDFWGPGMRVDPADRRIVDRIAPEQGDWVCTKWRYSAFFQSDLLALMRDHGRDQLIVCGVYAHVGVLATAVEAFTNDIQTFLVADAVADFSATYHGMAVEYAAERCASVATTSGLLRQLALSADHAAVRGSVG
jgi:isochorismate hydrolase